MCPIVPILNLICALVIGLKGFKRFITPLQGFTEPLSDKLLPDLPPGMQNVFTLVLDLNETLVYSDWKVRPKSLHRENQLTFIGDLKIVE